MLRPALCVALAHSECCGQLFPFEGPVFGSAVLEVVFGLAFFFAVFSFGCAAALELLASIRCQRGKQLAIFLERMLGAELSAQFYEHGLIRSLTKARRLPSYLPARSFALTVLDLLSIESPADRSKLDQVSGGVGQVLRVLSRDAADLDQLASRLEQWFDAAMARCSGAYRRRMCWASFGVAFAMAASLNADALEIASVLYADAHLRLSNVTQNEGDAQMLQTLLGRPRRDVAEKTPSFISVPVETGLLPLGWENSHFAARAQLSERPWSDPAFWAGPVLSKVLALVATALAASLAAGVWFDLLRRCRPASKRTPSD